MFRKDKTPQFENKVAVITGAAAGMGRSLAVELARRGARLAISDINSDGLDETRRRCETLGASVMVDILNTIDRERMLDYAHAVVERFGTVNYVFNNAGIGFVGSVEQTEFKDIERVMDVDFWGVVNGTKAFLPFLIASGDGHIVNTSSVFGLFSTPGTSAYHAAKFAVRGFTESLRQEMLVSRHAVKVTCVHPGGIRTDIAKNTTTAAGNDMTGVVQLFDRFAMTSADSAARIILKGVESGSPRVLVGVDAHLLDVLVRIAGSTYQRPVAFVARHLLPKGTLD